MYRVELRQDGGEESAGRAPVGGEVEGQHGRVGQHLVIVALVHCLCIGPHWLNLFSADTVTRLPYKLRWQGEGHHRLLTKALK